MADDATAAGDGNAAALERVLAAGLPDRRVTDLSALEGDGDGEVFAVSTADGERFVLKYAPDQGAASALRRETAVTNYVRRETDVPVAEPVSCGFEGSDPGVYFLTRWAAGKRLDDALAALQPHAHPQVFANVGETLARLHAGTSFDDPGAIEPTGPASFEVEPAGSWPELFAGRLAENVEALQGTRFEGVAEEVWTYVSQRLQDLETGTSPVLLHGDVGDGNLVYDGTAVSHVLDWERAFVGHPEYDLCRAEVRYFLNDWGRESREGAMLYAGYRSVRETPSDFEARRRCYLATFFLLPLARYPQWGPAFTDDLDGFAERIADRVRSVVE